MSTVLAAEPGACCVKGIKHEGTPVGSTIHIGGLQSYISRPPNNSSDKIMLFFPDIHGPFHLNNELIMDHFASNGYLVVAPDYLEGDYVQDASKRPDFEIMSWVVPKLPVAMASTPKWLDTVMKEFGTEMTKYVAVGYCFGAPFVLDLCATDRIVAGAIAHAAFLEEHHFRKVKKPLLLSCAEVDPTFPTKSRHRGEEILAEVKAPYHFQVFSGVEHGFALRGDPKVENERWAKEESARGILGWWERFINQDKSRH